MKIYVGYVDADEVDAFGEDGLVGPNSDGSYFGQYVEYGTNAGGLDEVAIGDGCNRMVPICVENLPDLIAALQEIQNNVEKIAEAKQLKKKMKSDGVAYVEDEEVLWDWEQSFQDADW
jgi:hypothetical protein